MDYAAYKLSNLRDHQEAGGGRNYFDFHFLEKQLRGGPISVDEYAKSLHGLLGKRKPNQKLTVVDFPAGEGKTIKALYLADRSTNSIERRIFRPGLLNKLANQAARDYIVKFIGVEFSRKSSISSQSDEIEVAIGPLVAQAAKIEKGEREEKKG